MMMNYIRTIFDDGTTNPDIVIGDDGVMIRRANTPRWRAYEKWLAAGNAPADQFTMSEYATLNEHARQRAHVRGLRPAGLEPPLQPIRP